MGFDSDKVNLSLHYVIFINLPISDYYLLNNQERIYY